MCASWLAAPIQNATPRLQAEPHRDSISGQGFGTRRLVSYNEPTRMDFVVHFSLALAAVVGVICSLRATFDFCTRLDRIAQSFQIPSPVVATPGEGENSFTNATGVEARALDASQAPQTNLPSFAPEADRGVGSPASG